MLFPVSVLSHATIILKCIVLPGQNIRLKLIVMNANLKVLTGIQVGEVRSLSAREIWISQNENEELEIGASDPGDSKKLAVLSKSSGGWFLEPISGDDWYIDGNRVELSQKSKIKPGSAIRLSWKGPDIGFSVGDAVPEVRGRRDAEVKDEEDKDDEDKSNESKGSTTGSKSRIIVMALGAAFALFTITFAASGLPGVFKDDEREDLAKNVLANENERLKADQAIAEADRRKAEADIERLKKETKETELQLIQERNRMSAFQTELLQLVLDRRGGVTNSDEKETVNQSANSQVHFEPEDRLERLEAKQRELDLINESRKEIMASIDAQERLKPELNLELVHNRMKRLELMRRRKMHELVSGPIEGNLSAINSGRALNILLERLGPVASEYLAELELLEQQIENLEAIVRTRKGKGSDGNYETELIKKKAALELLESIKCEPLPKICIPDFKTGPFRSSARYSAKDGPIYINWRRFEILRGFECKQDKEIIESCRLAALEQLDKREYVDIDTLSRLYAANENLKFSLERFGDKNIVNTLPFHHEQFTAWIDAKKEQRAMTRDFQHLRDISSIDYIAPAVDFTNGTVIELLAYMSDNGLRFEHLTSRKTQRKNYLTFLQLMEFQSTLVELQIAVELEPTDSLTGKYDKYYDEFGKSLDGTTFSNPGEEQTETERLLALAVDSFVSGMAEEGGAIAARKLVDVFGKFVEMF